MRIIVCNTVTLQHELKTNLWLIVWIELNIDVLQLKPPSFRVICNVLLINLSQDQTLVEII